MDLLEAEKANGRSLIKVGALACFLLAGLLLIASLLVPPPTTAGTDKDDPAGSTASLR
jgi:hypothetical protein